MSATYTDQEKANLFAAIREKGFRITDSLDYLRREIARETGIETTRTLNEILAYCLTRIIVRNQVLDVVRTAGGRDE